MPTAPTAPTVPTASNDRRPALRRTFWHAGVEHVSLYHIWMEQRDPWFFRKCKSIKNNVRTAIHTNNIPHTSLVWVYQDRMSRPQNNRAQPYATADYVEAHIAHGNANQRDAPTPGDTGDTPTPGDTGDTPTPGDAPTPDDAGDAPTKGDANERDGENPDMHRALKQTGEMLEVDDEVLRCAAFLYEDTVSAFDAAKYADCMRLLHCLSVAYKQYQTYPVVSIRKIRRTLGRVLSLQFESTVNCDRELELIPRLVTWMKMQRLLGVVPP